jgi:2-methylcitrate dehydratase PrpD
VLPAVLALGEIKQSSGADVMLAYQLGVEVECKVAEAIAPRHYEDGFHSTGTCGVFGSAIAASKLHGFNPEETVRVMGIGGSQAAGLRENFGTMMKPFHAGHAAEVGIYSADLAALGWTATDKILEAPRGFFHAYGGSYDADSILHRLGKPWSLANPGVSIKPFPSGSLTHPAMGEVLRLVKENDIHAPEVEKIVVGTNKNMPNALIHHHPTNELQAKFSMEFCVAILVLERKAGLSEFTTAVVNRPDVQAMINRVQFGVDPEAEASGYDKMTSIVKVYMKNGKVYSGRADFAKGSPTNPMSYDEVADKFYGCCSAANWPQAKAKAIVQAVKDLQSMRNIRDFIALCSK